MKRLYIEQARVCYLMGQGKLRIKLILRCFLFLFSVSCENFVDVDPPQSELTGEVVFEDVATANATLANIYAKLRDNALSTGRPSGITYLIGLYADELNLASFGGQAEPFNINALIPTDDLVTSLWSDAYNLIFETNAIIQGVENSTTLSLEDKDQIKGEALFLRAFLHFYLVNLFGDIPYITTSDFRVNTVVSRIPAQEVYVQLISDLGEAKRLLPAEYVTGERIRANRAVASALLARIYLYTEEWEKTTEESTNLINNSGLFTLENDLNKVFLKDSGSTIWQLKSIPGSNTNEGSTFIFISAPPINASLNNALIDAFESGDQRQAQWTANLSDGTNVFYFPFKYKEQFPTGSSLEYSILFRLAEQYLIRAEARAQLGDINGAQQDLNIIRNRAGLGATPAATTSDLLDAILQERQVELFTELGHRFFDLKRTGRIDTVLGPIKPGWDATDVLLPIPESEILVNPNLAPQNPGY
ncbi:MAG: RagB/SusD family nutrient uptake outer membrane protein [Saonia sp.]